MTETKQEELRQKIADGQARLEERTQSLLEKAGEKAVEARDGVTNFAKDHPIAAVAGGLAVGVLISGLIYRRRQNRSSDVSAKVHDVRDRAATLATLGVDYVIDYAMKALDAAGEAGRAGADRVSDLGDSVESGTRDLRRNAGHLAEELGDRVSAAGHDAGERLRSAKDSVSDIVSRTLRHH
ncbi:hypothetical protein GRI97_17910 [Altererythrobacter xixiisoli]|uniref:DUF883 domain-containing protein n=1 Tax=Croceibacterium xixiisoli TaxID=1476466 RepID=A0A6I4U1V7_9SPHN|nr:hypothetical protein [Croceibacterium xixiisoli]MXP00868.1 hypothetical protein [Croceibacterium xixiisoli]